LLSQGSPPSKPLPPTPRPTTAVPGVYITVAAAAAAAERIAALPPTSNACGRRKAATFALSTSSVRHRAQEAAGKATMTDGGDSPSQQEPFANGAISMVSTAVKNLQLRGGWRLCRTTSTLDNRGAELLELGRASVGGKSQARAGPANPGRHRLFDFVPSSLRVASRLTRRVSDDNGQRWQSEVDPYRSRRCDTQSPQDNRDQSAFSGSLCASCCR
jgi:hypothetical protein